MKDLTDYIVEEDGKFYVDCWDVDSGDAVFEQGEVRLTKEWLQRKMMKSMMMKLRKFCW